jgi:arabinose-5-phosphate isomerase
MTRLAAIDLAFAKKVLNTEAAAILALVDRLDERFEGAVRMLLECHGHGRVIVTGAGKSGIIGQKIAATLASTGTPAFFLHPSDALHGDLGVLQPDDVVIALSYSGETDELLQILQTVKRLGARLIALTGDCESALGKAADVAIDCAVSAEACPLGLAPTASTTAALALGDALAMSVLVAKGFRLEDFAKLHPGGRLGRQLMRVEQLMHAGDTVPTVGLGTPMPDVIYEMSRKGLGMTCVVDDQRRLRGVITDGDLRRHMSTTQNLLALTAADTMTPEPRTIGGEMLAVEALDLMERGPRKITSLVVVNSVGRVDGVIHIHDLLRTEIF